MDERIREMRLKLDKIAWEPEQSEKNKRAFDFIVVYSDYLIQQAEKVQELETLLHGSKLMTDEALETIEKLQKQNQRYKEALEFYANKINYQVFIENGKSNIEHDGGSKARRELEGES